MQRIAKPSWVFGIVPVLGLVGCAVGDKEVTLLASDKAAAHAPGVVGPSDSPRDFMSADRLKPRVEPYAPTQTHGNIRVTLLSVGHVTRFLAPNGEVSPPTEDGPYAVPGVRVEYVAEALGDGPAGAPWYMTSPFGVSAMTVSGRAVQSGYRNVSVGDFSMVGVPYRWYKAVTDDTSLPPVEQEDRAAYGWFWKRGAVVEGGYVDVELQFRFDGKVETFTFTGVPLR